MLWEPWGSWVVGHMGHGLWAVVLGRLGVASVPSPTVVCACAPAWQVCATAAPGPTPLVVDCERVLGPGAVVAGVHFASFGTPVGSCGAWTFHQCHAAGSRAAVQAACMGQVGGAGMGWVGSGYTPLRGRVKREWGPALNSWIAGLLEASSRCPSCRWGGGCGAGASLPAFVLALSCLYRSPGLDVCNVLAHVHTVEGSALVHRQRDPACPARGFWGPFPLPADGGRRAGA